jgi:hypothetical protein
MQRHLIAINACSGSTPEVPGLLRYACKLQTNVRPVKSATVRVHPDEGDEAVTMVMSGKPLLALAFDNMKVGWPACAPMLVAGPLDLCTCLAAQTQLLLCDRVLATITAAQGGAVPELEICGAAFHCLIT